MKAATHGQQMRIRIAQEAARLMAQEGVKDFYAAKRKAAAHFGAPDTTNMPRNIEVEEALQELHRIYGGDAQPEVLYQLREVAIEAMKFLKDFHPALVGSVLRGTAGEFAEINLHLFADTSEEVGIFLMDANIPFETTTRKLRFGRDAWKELPAFRFLAEEFPLELIVFPYKGRYEAPRSSVDGQPMQRASVGEVSALLALA